MEKAVALKYESDLPAPFIVAKGKGELGKKIKELAVAHNIPLTRDDAVVENLIELEPGEFIPEIYYKIIAEILVLIGELR